MESGIVNFFDPVKGYGFIRREKGQDVMFKSEDISDNKYTVDIPRGTAVKFNAIKTKKGFRTTELIFP